MGAGFGEDRYTVVLGFYWNTIRGIVHINNKSFLPLGFLVEGGYANYDNSPDYPNTPNNKDINTSEDLGYFAPGIYMTLVNDILYFSYSYGRTVGKKNQSQCCGSNFDKGRNDLSSTYTKLGLGINIKI